MRNVNIVNLRSLLMASGGTFIGITFTKKDGSTRNLNGRLLVSKGVKGTGHKISLDKPSIRIYDVKTDGFRTVNLSTTKSLRMFGMEYQVTG
jgi:hypothetical protein